MINANPSPSTAPKSSFIPTSTFKPLQAHPRPPHHFHNNLHQPQPHHLHPMALPSHSPNPTPLPNQPNNVTPINKVSTTPKSRFNPTKPKQSPQSITEPAVPSAAPMFHPPASSPTSNTPLTANNTSKAASASHLLSLAHPHPVYKHPSQPGLHNQPIPIPSSSPITSDTAPSKSPSPCPSPPPSLLPHSAPASTTSHVARIQQQTKTSSTLPIPSSSSTALSPSLPSEKQVPSTSIISNPTPQIPSSSSPSSSSLSRPQPSSKGPQPNAQLQAPTLLNAAVQLTLPSTQTLPDSISLLSPSYPATLFGGLSPDDEHVTVWEPATGKTVAGNAAPYRRNLVAWLAAHPGWEEKADELKSSKRRSAARRSRAAAHSFAAACCYPAAVQLASDASRHLSTLNYNNNDAAAMSSWTVDDFVRLQESLARATQMVHKHAGNISLLDCSRWANITKDLGASKLEPTVVYCAHYMLTRGIAKSLSELSNFVSSASPTKTLGQPINEEDRKAAQMLLPAGAGSIAHPPVVSPASLLVAGTPASSIHAKGHVNETEECKIGCTEKSNDTTSVIPNGLENENGSLMGMPKSLGEKSFGMMPAAPAGAAAVLERSFRAPREPRVTVWNPANRRTISGNAAPCRRNLEAWMKQHPGWVPKEEGQLSSSRRNRNRTKGRPSSVPTTSAGGPIAAIAVAAAASVGTTPVGLKTSGHGSTGTTTGSLLCRTPALPLDAGTAPLSILQGTEPESPHFHDALEGLLVLSRSPHAASAETIRQLKVGNEDIDGIGMTKASGINVNSNCININQNGKLINGNNLIGNSLQSMDVEMNDKVVQVTKAIQAMNSANHKIYTNDLVESEESSDEEDDDDMDEDDDDVDEGYVHTSSVSNCSAEDGGGGYEDAMSDEEDDDGDDSDIEMS